MFGTKKMAITTLCPITNLQNFSLQMIGKLQTTNVFHQEFTYAKALDFASIWVGYEFPKDKWKTIPLMPNQLLASKMFCF